MSEAKEITYTASIMPCKIMVTDTTIRTTFSAPLTEPMNAVQAVLTEWMMKGRVVEITVSVKEPKLQLEYKGRLK